MAFKKLATVTTLDQMQANVRSRTQTLSQQLSQLIDPQLDHICHDAIMKVYSLSWLTIRGLYETDVTVTEATNLIDISTYDLNIAGRWPCLYDATHGEIPILPTQQFFVRKKIDAAVTTRLIARITNILATDNKLQIQTDRGSAVTTAGVLTLVYSRVPKRTLEADADRLLDLPERLIPLGTDYAIKMVFDRVGQTPPSDVVDSIKTQVSVLVGELKGLESQGEGR